MRARIMFRNGADVIVEIEHLNLTYNNQGELIGIKCESPEKGHGEYLQWIDPRSVMCVTNFFEEHRPK